MVGCLRCRELITDGSNCFTLPEHRAYSMLHLAHNRPMSENIVEGLFRCLYKSPLLSLAEYRENPFADMVDSPT